MTPPRKTSTPKIARKTTRRSTGGAAAVTPQEHDLDAVLARLETGIAREREAMDRFLRRLTSRAAV